MQALLLIGKRKDDKGAIVTECLYCGLDGVARAQVAKDAVASDKGYYQLGNLTNPMSTPVGIDPRETKVTTPVFPRPKSIESVPKIQPPPESIAKSEATTKVAREEALRKSRLAMTDTKNATPPVKPPAKINDGGPTFEEYIKAGYKAENYPPHGFAAKESPGYTAYLEKITAPATVPPVAVKNATDAGVGAPVANA